MSTNRRILEYHRGVSSRIALILLSFAASLLAACGGNSSPAPIDGAVCTAPGTTAFMSACTMNTDCASCLCQNFGHVTLCTKSCTVAGDCALPSHGCTNNVCSP